MLLVELRKQYRMEIAMSFKNCKPENSGIVLLMVIVVLVILLLLAIIFATSVRVEKRLTSSEMAKVRAKLAARGVLNYAMAQLTKTCETRERHARQDDPYKTPDYDSLLEYHVDIQVPKLNLRNPRGQMWSSSIEDEQGKIDVNSATPWLLGNLMGSAIVTESASPTNTDIVVDTTHSFPTDGGYLWINGELIHYRRTATDRFLECERGMFQNSPRFIKAQTLTPGTLVIDARAYRICQYRVRAQPGYFTPFRTVEEIRRIADEGIYAIDARLFDRIEPFLTVHSGRNSGQGWIFPQRIASYSIGENAEDPDILEIPSTCFYRPGMTVRLTAGETRVYAIIRQIDDDKITLDDKFPTFANVDKVVIEVLETHPININSASPRVIYSVFKGLRSGGKWFDTDKASRLTNFILEYREKKAIRSLADLQKVLSAISVEDQRWATENKTHQGFTPISEADIITILSSARSISGSRRRFSGIATTQVYDAYRVVWPPLASLVFRNQDTYSIEATAVISDDSAMPIAQETINCIATVAPSESLRWDITSQKDFETYMDNLPSFRVITWPNLVNHFSVYPQEDTKDTGLSLDTVSLAYPAPWGSTLQPFKWDNTHEGITVPCDQAPNLTFDHIGLEIKPGCLSFWFYPQNARGICYLFDMGEAEWENRIRCFCQDNRLYLQVADTTEEKSFCEVIAPLKLDSQWYHIMAAWYSTDPGGLALWIDGEPRGEFGYRGKTQYLGTLTKSLKADSPSISIDNTANFPREGVVRIGNEAIEYSEIIGNMLVVRTKYEGFELKVQGRGARATAPNEHPQGCGVYPFGYSDPLDSNVFPGTKLSQNFPTEDVYATIGTPLFPTDTSILVSKASKFQPSGFILIADCFSRRIEKVRYLSFQGSKFNNCQRGQLETKAQQFEQAYVFPISMAVDNNHDFEETGMIQVEDEWLSYVRKVDDNFFIFNIGASEIDQFKRTSKVHPQYRGTCDTMSSKHDYGASVLPVFQTKHGRCGRGDRVTIIKENNPQEKEEKTINWAYQNQVAFDRDVLRTYTRSDSTRVLKFPSGELPVSLGNKTFWGSPAFDIGSPTPILIDELQWIQSKTRNHYFLTKALNPQSDDLVISQTMNLPRDGGLLKIGDEYVSYRMTSVLDVSGVERKFAHSQGTSHSVGTAIFPVFFLAISSLDITLNTRSSVISIADPGDFPQEGYLKCGTELISYTSIEQSGLSMPQGKDKQGIWRGSFGTDVQIHPSGSIVYSFPVRYWDRSAIDYDGKEMAYFEAAKSAPGAYWERIQWQAEVPSTEYMGIQIRARVDGKPSWEESPTNRKGGIFQFDTQDAANRLDVAGDTLEMRVYFPYKKDSYPEKYWKARTILRSITVYYHQPPRIWEIR